MRRKPIKEIDGYLCVGVVTGAKGIKGDVRIKSFTGDPKALGDYGPLRDESGKQSFSLKVTGENKGLITARIKGVDDRNKAEDLKGTALYIARDALPEADEDEFYYIDLIGLRADLVDQDQGLGFVKQVHDFGAGCILEIEGPDKETHMVPFTKAVVPEVNMNEGRLVIDPPPGLLESKPQDDGLGE